MNNNKDVTGLFVNFNLSGKLFEKLVLILLSSLFSFNLGYYMYAEQNRVENFVDRVHTVQTKP